MTCLYCGYDHYSPPGISGCPLSQSGTYLPSAESLGWYQKMLAGIPVPEKTKLERAQAYAAEVRARKPEMQVRKEAK